MVKLLFQLTDALHDATETKEITLFASLDVEWVLNKTSHDLIGKGVEITLAFSMGKMLESRQVAGSIGRNFIAMNNIPGYPQGGVLSPLIWNIVVNGLQG